MGYPGMTAAQKRYNKAHKSARAAVERIIGILKRRWACLKRTQIQSRDMLQSYCCMLYVA